MATKRCYENNGTAAVECSSCRHQHRCEMGRDLDTYLKQFAGRIDITEDQYREIDDLVEAQPIGEGYIWDT